MRDDNGGKFCNHVIDTAVGLPTAVIAWEKGAWSVCLGERTCIGKGSRNLLK